MKNKIILKSYSLLMFGEGGKDKKWIIKLIELDKFKYHTRNWNIQYDNASGGSPNIILKKCRNITSKIDYDLILCFIDVDVLKREKPKTWDKEKFELEEKYSEIKIVWNEDNAEDEFRKYISHKNCGKHKTNKLAKEELGKIINTPYWHKILNPIKEKEDKLNNN